MLWSKKITISMIICVLIAIFIRMIFFNNNYNIDDIKDPILYYKEQVSAMNSKLPNTMNYKVINIFQRKNPTVYTQGLFFYNYSIYESGGLYNKSSLVHMEWPSQKVIQKINLEEKYFAEGIAASNVNNILYQLTYQEKEILLYSFPQLKLKSKIKMPRELREGWGLCPGKEKDEFFATDGSDKIFVLKINKTNNELNVTSYIHVTRNMRPIYRLNELIYDGVFIYCNVYFERAILKINPHNGEVMNIYNMQPLIDYELENGKLTKNRLNGGDVLNGIVYIPEKKSYILTGKMWDYYYEIVFN
jgi:glutamine cyclotransferase